ncbi:hypothetical protein [Streptomyces boluensis]|uniref:WXG100 family type VII secretion target n=1 Tax=Streptomyces boluensis TaxID=1775135 RepID=A0A964UQN7_9ACTN|nr:hypothetical protein [Streptomyces boluensis]NBE52726.1 hypothetical protein [Streptomyces boluensis]
MSGDEQKPVLEQEVCVGGRPETKTQFIDYSLKELKQMLDGSDWKKIEATSDNWGHVHRILAGGQDNLADRLEKAINNVLEHWSGEAANSFAKKARQISKNIRNAAWYADLNRGQFADAAGQLKEYKGQLDDIKEPGFWDKSGDALSDWSWDNGESTAKDLNNKNMTASQVAEANEGKIGASREAQLKAVAVMENLGVQYARVTRNLNANPVRKDDNGNIKDPDGNVEYAPPVGGGGGGGASVPGAGGTTKPWNAGPPKGIGATPEIPRDKGISGGSQIPPTKTNIDSAGPGLTGKGSLPAGGGGISGAGGGTAGGGGAAGGAFVPTGGGAAGGGRAGLGAGGARAGGAGTGRGAGGRAGMGGMGGGMGGGAGAGRGAGAGGRGALAKARGGVVGAAKGITGKGGGGGGGLHGSRGGSQRAGMAGGMAGGMGGRGGRRGEENEGRERPDYLVEDEETWVSEEDRKRNVPKNID